LTATVWPFELSDPHAASTAMRTSVQIEGRQVLLY